MSKAEMDKDDIAEVVEDMLGLIWVVPILVWMFMAMPGLGAGILTIIVLTSLGVPYAIALDITWIVGVLAAIGVPIALWRGGWV